MTKYGLITTSRCALLRRFGVGSHIAMIGSSDGSPDRVHDYELAKCYGW